MAGHRCSPVYNEKVEMQTSYIPEYDEEQDIIQEYDDSQEWYNVYNETEADG